MSKVAIIGENSIGYVSTLIDIWNNGDCAVLIDWKIPFFTVLEMMTEAGVHTCFIERCLFEKIKNNIPDSFNFITYEKLSIVAELMPGYIYDKFQDNYNKSDAVVIYSSGTTGKSKGIILSHFAINTNADAIINYMRPSNDDCMMIVKTLSHSSTLVGELLVGLKSKIKIVISPTLAIPRYVLNNILKFNVTIMCVNPTLLLKYAKEYSVKQYYIKSLNKIYVSGSILHENVYAFAKASFKNILILNVYGLSEAGPRVTAQLEDSCKNNSVGRPINGVDVAIVGNDGSRVLSGHRGIVHVKTESVFSGYICGDIKYRSLYNGWLNTGDIGYFDENGDLHIISRIDDLIIIDAHKIYPSEVEKKIIDMLHVDECVVQSSVVGTRTVLCCLYSGTYKINSLIARKQLQDVLMLYEIPLFFIQCDDMPKNTNGKISIKGVKKAIEEFLKMNYKEEIL